MRKIPIVLLLFACMIGAAFFIVASVCWRSGEFWAAIRWPWSFGAWAISVIVAGVWLEWLGRAGNH